MTIYEDTRQQAGKNDDIRQQLESLGYTVRRTKVAVGDYVLSNRGDISVDTKQGMKEVYGNLIQQHERFRRELLRAQEDGVQLYILVTEDGIPDVFHACEWKNKAYDDWFMIFAAHKKGKLLYRRIAKQPPVSPARLQEMMITIQNRYGVKWVFCKRSEAGAKIVELLNA